MKLAYIAFRCREHGVSAYIFRDSVVAYKQDAGVVFLTSWDDARQLLGYF